MAGGALWTREEDALIADMVAAGSTNPSIVKAFQARFPGKRGPSSIIKRRSQLGLGAESIPTEPDEKIEVGDGYVRVAASKSIRDPETLFARSGLDPKVWEMVNDGSATVKKWDVPMKLEEGPVVVPCFYVAIKVRKKWAESGLPSHPKAISFPCIGETNISRIKMIVPFRFSTRSSTCSIPASSARTVTFLTPNRSDGGPKIRCTESGWPKKSKWARSTSA